MSYLVHGSREDILARPDRKGSRRPRRPLHKGCQAQLYPKHAYALRQRQERHRR